MDVQDMVLELMQEVDYLKGVIDLLEVGFSFNGYGDHKAETACIHVINKYLKMIRDEIIDKIAESLLGDK